MPVIARSVSLPAAVSALMIACAAGLLAPFGLLGLPVAALLLIVSARSIARREHEASAAACTPFAELAAAYAPAGDGDLRVRAEGDLDGEAGELADVLNGALDRVDEAIGQAVGSTATLSRAAGDMGRASDQARSSVVQIAATITEVARGATDQANAAERAAISMSEIHDGLTGVAGRGGTVAEAATSASSAAGEGAETLENAAQAIRRADEAVTEGTDVVGHLGERAEQIGSIVSAIEQIAAQTNLLALNASIEAARAGDEGRGFAVVAEEVRVLAEGTQEQVGSIAEIVSDIQRAARQAVEASETGVAAVNDGSRQMEHVAEAFAAIQQQVAAVVAEAEAVAAEAHTLQTAADAARDELGSVAAVAEENAAAAEMVATSSAETATSVDLVDGACAQVVASAEALERLVSGFAVSGTGTTPAVVEGNDLHEVVQAALVAHAAWKDRLRTAIEEGSSELDPGTVSKDDVCPFGEWLHGDDGHRHKGEDGFGRIHDLHAEFHVAAAAVLEQVLAGQLDEAERMMDVNSDFHRISATLSKALTAWGDHAPVAAAA